REGGGGHVGALPPFSTERETVATVNHTLGTDAVFVARLVGQRRPEDRVWDPPRPLLEVRLLGGSPSNGVFILANSLRLESLAGFTRWNPRALGPWLLILALLVRPFVRGWGSVVARPPLSRHKSE